MASQCYLSTRVGPSIGLLFIFMDKVAFCNIQIFEFARNGNSKDVKFDYSIASYSLGHLVLHGLLVTIMTFLVVAADEVIMDTSGKVLFLRYNCWESLLEELLGGNNYVHYKKIEF